MDRIFDPVHPNWIHQFFWNPVSIEGGAKCRDLSIANRDKAFNAAGSGYSRIDNTFNPTQGDEWAPINEGDISIPARASHFWGGGTDFDARNIVRASNSNFSARSCNSTTNSAASSNSGTIPPANSSTNASSPTSPYAATNSSASPDPSATSSSYSDPASTSPSRETQGTSKGSGVCLQFRQRGSL